MEEEKNEITEEIKEVKPTPTQTSNSGLTEKIRRNPWVVSTFILGIIVVILLVTTFSGGFSGSGKVISSNQIGEKLLKFYEDNGATGLTINSTKEISGVYEVDFNYRGDIIPIYVTKDGSLAGSLNFVDLTGSSTSNTSTQNQEVPKTEKPSVELYVFTYCPYGLQMEKAVIPVVKLFGDKINFKLRQIGAMHGEFEKIEAERQLCIEKNYKDKFLDYVLAFAEDTSCPTGEGACVTNKTSALFSKLGIDASKINACISSEGQTLYDAEVANAESNSVTGSPTLMINGVIAESGRNPEAVKGTICTAFNTVPTQCSQKLSTTSASAGFGSGTSNSSTSASCS